VIVIGVISDRFRVRKPFMVIGGVLAAVMTVIYLEQAGHHPGYYTLAIMLALLAFGLGIAYTPWMASYTETVEARNPALIATGLAIWGWIIRIVVFVAYLFIPVVINSVTPLVNYGATVSSYATTYASDIAFATAHPTVVATAQSIPPNVLATAQKIPPSVLATAKTDATQLANAVKFAPELKVIQANPALATVAPYAADLQTIAPYSAQLTAIAPYSAQLTALSKVPPQVFPYLKAHGAAVQKAAAQTAGQWKTWYWICFGGIIFFLLSIPLLKGRWRTRDAKRDEAEHEAMVQAELTKLTASP
jgi:hypothetical protein